MDRLTDDAEDLTLPQRPRRPELRPEARATARPASQEDLADDVADDRELTLNTGTVLALFFGLALICAVFFGFGYSMGRKSAPAAVPETASTGADATASAGPEVATNKPAAGSPAVQPIPSYQSQGQTDAVSRSGATQTSKAASPVKTNTPTTVTVPMETATAPAKPKKAPVDDVDGRIVEAAKPAAAKPVVIPPAMASGPVQTMNAGTPVPGGSNYVQIAAVSHKEDADVLLSALRRRGYTVFTRSSDADKLIHVQVGPFATKKDADAMRQRLLGDGYNAILK